LVLLAVARKISEKKMDARVIFFDFFLICVFSDFFSNKRVVINLNEANSAFRREEKTEQHHYYNNNALSESNKL